MAINVVAVVAALVGAYVLSQVVPVLVQAFQPSLARIPNAHWSAPFSPAWLLWHKGRKTEHTARLNAHKKLGPVMRVSPNEVSINCIDGGVRTVYGGNWDKSEYYSVFENYGHHPLFSTLDGKKHAARKRMLAGVYTKTFIDNSADLDKCMKVVNEDRLLPLLRDAAKAKKEVNVLYLAESYFMDITTAYIYGLQNATNYIENPEEGKKVLHAFETSLGPDTFFLLYFPRLTGLLAKINLHLVPFAVYECFPTFLGFGMDMSVRTKKSLEEKPKGEQTEPIVYNYFHKLLLESKPPAGEVDNIVASEMLDQLHAAHQASGIFMAYLMWELCKDRETQEQLIREIKACRTEGRDPVHSKLVEDIFLEGMRLHPAAWGPFPRTAPAGGAQIADYAGIPEGTVVSVSPYTLGRNPEVFPNPDAWNPSRWTDASADERKEMMRWIWFFGSGARVCIGRYLAEITMRSFIVNVYENFRTTVAKETNMKHVEAMMAIPEGYQMQIHLEPLKA